MSLPGDRRSSVVGELERQNRATYYVVREIWVDGNDVVVEVQGVRSDGSYWVSGFQMRFTMDEWASMTSDQILARIKAEVLKNERYLDEMYNKMRADEEKTRVLRQGENYKRLVGSRIDLV